MAEPRKPARKPRRVVDIEDSDGPARPQRSGGRAAQKQPRRAAQEQRRQAAGGRGVGDAAAAGSAPAPEGSTALAATASPPKHGKHRRSSGQGTPKADGGARFVSAAGDGEEGGAAVADAIAAAGSGAGGGGGGGGAGGGDVGGGAGDGGAGDGAGGGADGGGGRGMGDGVDNDSGGSSDEGGSTSYSSSSEFGSSSSKSDGGSEDGHGSQRAQQLKATIASQREQIASMKGALAASRQRTSDMGVVRETHIERMSLHDERQRRVRRRDSRRRRGEEVVSDSEPDRTPSPRRRRGSNSNSSRGGGGGGSGGGGKNTAAGGGSPAGALPIAMALGGGVGALSGAVDLDGSAEAGGGERSSAADDGPSRSLNTYDHLLSVRGSSEERAAQKPLRGSTVELLGSRASAPAAPEYAPPPMSAVALRIKRAADIQARLATNGSIKRAADIQARVHGGAGAPSPSPSSSPPSAAELAHPARRSPPSSVDKASPPSPQQLPSGPAPSPPRAQTQRAAPGSRSSPQLERSSPLRALSPLRRALGGRPRAESLCCVLLCVPLPLPRRPDDSRVTADFDVAVPTFAAAKTAAGGPEDGNHVVFNVVVTPTQEHALLIVAGGSGEGARLCEGEVARRYSEFAQLSRHLKNASVRLKRRSVRRLVQLQARASGGGRTAAGDSCTLSPASTAVASDATVLLAQAESRRAGAMESAAAELPPKTLRTRSATKPSHAKFLHERRLALARFLGRAFEACFGDFEKELGRGGHADGQMLARIAAVGGGIEGELGRHPRRNNNSEGALGGGSSCGEGGAAVLRFLGINTDLDAGSLAYSHFYGFAEPAQPRGSSSRSRPSPSKGRGVVARSRGGSGGGGGGDGGDGGGRRRGGGGGGGGGGAVASFAACVTAVDDDDGEDAAAAEGITLWPSAQVAMNSGAIIDGHQLSLPPPPSELTPGVMGGKSVTSAAVAAVAARAAMARPRPSGGETRAGDDEGQHSSRPGSTGSGHGSGASTAGSGESRLTAVERIITVGISTSNHAGPVAAMQLTRPPRHEGVQAAPSAAWHGGSNGDEGSRSLRDGMCLFSGSAGREGALKVWDYRRIDGKVTLECRQTHNAHAGGTLALTAISTQSSVTLFSGGADGMLCRWSYDSIASRWERQRSVMAHFSFKDHKDHKDHKKGGKAGGKSSGGGGGGGGGGSGSGTLRALIAHEPSAASAAARARNAGISADAMPVAAARWLVTGGDDGAIRVWDSHSLRRPAPGGRRGGGLESPDRSRGGSNSFAGSSSSSSSSSGGSSSFGGFGSFGGGGGGRATASSFAGPGTFGTPPQHSGSSLSSASGTLDVHAALAATAMVPGSDPACVVTISSEDAGEELDVHSLVSFEPVPIQTAYTNGAAGGGGGGGGGGSGGSAAAGGGVGGGGGSPMPGCVLFAGLANGRVVAIDCDTWELLHSWQAHDAGGNVAVTALRISPISMGMGFGDGGGGGGGRRRRRQSCIAEYPGCLYTASCDGLIKVWRIDAARGWKLPDTSACALSLSGHLGPVRALGFFRGAEGALVSASDDLSLMAWDPAQGESESGGGSSGGGGGAGGLDDSDEDEGDGGFGGGHGGLASGAGGQWLARGIVGHTGGVQCLATADDLLFRYELLNARSAKCCAGGGEAAV